MDWGEGHYESTATRLAPAAERLVEIADPRPGEHVLDLGCGTGNASLLVAARGARVTGVDPAPRLLELARERFGGGASFIAGEAACIPLADASADLLVSVFGVIFAPDAHAAAKEMARVAAPKARIVLSAWRPQGAVFEAMRIVRQAVRDALGATSGEASFSWHEEDALSALLTPHGFSEVEATDQQLRFTASSAADYVEEQFEQHPMLLAARAALDRGGDVGALRRAVLAVFEQANEDPDGAFSVRSDYVILTARRP